MSNLASGRIQFKRFRAKGAPVKFDRLCRAINQEVGGDGMVALGYGRTLISAPVVIVESYGLK